MKTSKCKRKDNADLRISGDLTTLAWLAKTFGCSKEDAVAILYDVTKTRKGGFESAEFEFDANRLQGD